MSYHMPTRVVFGEGALKELCMLPELEPVRSVALFAGRRALREQGVLERVGDLLPGRELVLFDGIPPEPQPADLRAHALRLADSPCEAVIAIGGGSVLDVAKGAACCCRHGAPPFDTGAPLVPRERPLTVIAIPTTAGTGAEVTPFSTFWDLAGGRKLSLDHPSMFPEVALVDPALTHAMPPDLTASTGMDAFTQACEAYWNLNHHPTSDEHALRAVRLLIAALPRAVRDGRDAAARFAVARGSLEAGLAFGHTRTTACHSLSYPMTIHWRVPHGRAVGVTLPAVLSRNAAQMGDLARRRRFCEALGVTSIHDAVLLVRELMASCGIASRLRDLGIDRAGVDVIAREGLGPARMRNNPFAFDEASARDMLLELL